MTSRYRLAMGLIVAAALSNVACSSAGDEPETTPEDQPPVKTSQGCNLHTNYIGDEICIAPPAEKDGFQVHWGPSDYDDPDVVAPFLLDAGQETDIFVDVDSPLTEDVYFYKRQYRMRPGSHHLIVYEKGGEGSSIAGMGRRLGGSQNSVKDNPSGDLPPENAGIGMPLKATAELSFNLHHYNGTEEPILREAWVNFLYVDPETVTQEAREMFLVALGQNIPVNGHVTVAAERTVNADGRLLTTYGHRHSNNIRFTAFHHRGDEKTLIYEDYDWKEPAVLEYNSLTTNPAPDPEGLAEGGYSGILDLKAGDRLSWECEIINKSGDTIIFNQNEAITSEMCMLIGDTVGVAISPL